MDYIPDDIFNDLMLDLVGKYSGPPLAASDLQGLAVEAKPKIFKPAQEQQSRGSSCAKRASEPQKKIFSTLPHHNASPQFGGPIKSNEHVLGSHWRSSDLSSQKDGMLSGISDYRQYGTAANINEHAFSNHSKSSFFDTKNVGFLPTHADHWPPVSPAVSKVLPPSSHWLSSGVDSRLDSISLGVPGSPRCGNATEFNEQAYSSHSKSPFLETKKVPFLQTHDAHLRFSNPAESKMLAPNSHWLSSNVDSRNDINLPGISDGQQSTRAAENNEQASSNRSKSSFLSTRKVTILPKQDDHLRSGSSTDSKVPNPNSLLKPSTLESKIDSISSLLSDCRQSVSAAEINKRDCSTRLKSSSSETKKVTFLLDHETPRRSGSPAEGKVQAPINHLMSSPLDSRKDAPSLKLADNLKSSVAVSNKTPASISSVSPNPEFRKETALLKHAECRLSSNPESKEMALDNSSEVKGGDYRKDSPSLDYAHCLKSGSPEDSKNQFSSSHLEPRSNRVNHAGELGSYSNYKKKNGIAEIGKTEVNVQKEASLLDRTQVTGKKTKEENQLQKLKESIDDPDFLRICWKQLIKWADLTNEHDLKGDLVNCNLHTETFKSLIASFKCLPTPEHHQYCFARIGEGLHHPTFKSPSLDPELFMICSENDNKEPLGRVLEKIYPFDKDLEKIQSLIMKAIMPLFLVCNAYEVSSAGSQKQTPMSVYLCRHSLVLFGQIFSVISTMRQDRVLEALDLQGKPPQPSRYPNLDSACLFGPDYMTKLSLFMGKSPQPTAGHGATPIKEENVPEVNTTYLDAQVDAKSKVAIEKLARFVAEMGLEMEIFNIDKLARNPNFWFLNAERSPEYKLYYLKLAEFRQSFSASKWKPLDTQFKEQIPGSPKPILKHSGDTATSKTDCFTPPLLPPLRKRKAPLNTVPVPPKKASNEEPPKVDAKTRDTAEKLARFIVRMGPEMERFTKAEASNPEFWFLNQKDHPAYKYYQMKLEEFSKAKQAPAGSSDPKTPVPLKGVTTEKTKPQNTRPKNSASQAAEPQGALLLLSALYDSGEEDSPSEDDVRQDSKHQVRRHQRSRSRTDSASGDSRRTSSRHSSRVGFR